MIILGIDPGTATTGFGIIRVVGNSIKPVDYGIISTPPGVPMEQRLVMIYEQINQIIQTWKPEQVAIEELFFNKNITTGITVGQARGVLLLACALLFYGFGKATLELDFQRLLGQNYNTTETIP